MLLPNFTTYSDFRAHLADHLGKLSESDRPTVVLKKGKAAAVVMSPERYQAGEDALRQVELLAAVRASREQIAVGQSVPWSSARARLLKSIEPKKVPSRSRKPKRA
jgi:PHD/YefM family antitoxin component YafN of YafNO toxin-antitoxin module